MDKLDGGVAYLEEMLATNRKYYCSIFFSYSFSNKSGILFIVLSHQKKYEEKPRTRKVSKKIVQSSEKNKNEQAARSSHTRTKLRREHHWIRHRVWTRFNRFFSGGI